MCKIMISSGVFLFFFFTKSQVSPYMKSLKQKQNAPPDNTSKEVDHTTESGSSRKELHEFRKQ